MHMRTPAKASEAAPASDPPPPHVYGFLQKLHPALGGPVPMHDPDADGVDVAGHGDAEDASSSAERDYLNPADHPVAHGDADGKDLTVDPARNRYPYCIVWSPLPMITWFCPVIGHMGICDSRGVIWDFAGPYTINRNDMAFGRPTRYLQLDPKLCRAPGAGEGDAGAKALWDKCVHFSNCHYAQRMHNICCQNCHHHTARAMNQMKYRGLSTWNQVTLAFWVFFCGKFPSAGAFLCTFGPFAVLLGAYLLLMR